MKIQGGQDDEKKRNEQGLGMCCSVYAAKFGDGNGRRIGLSLGIG